MEDKMVTLNVKESTKKRFNDHGVKGQTDDTLLNHLLDTHDEYYKKAGDTNGNKKSK